MDKSYWYFTAELKKSTLSSSSLFISFTASSVVESENNLFPILRVEKKLSAKKNEGFNAHIIFVFQISKEDFDSCIMKIS